MKASEFKNQVRGIKEFLLGKEIRMTLVTKNGVESLSFDSLRGFGNKILELEKLGFGFSFVQAANNLTQARMITEKEIARCMRIGVWHTIHVNASNLK